MSVHAMSSVLRVGPSSSAEHAESSASALLEVDDVSQFDAARCG